MRIDPGDVRGFSVLLDKNGFEGRLGLHLIKALAQYLAVQMKCFRKRLDKRIPIDGFGVLARKDDAIDWPRVDQQMSIAIEYHAPGRGNRQQTNALIFSYLRVMRAVYDLQKIETNREHAEHHQDQHLDDVQARAEVLGIVNEFHRLTNY